mmetsp:Transcript_52559/g.132194  ORF Transcript_52559/g.132194 Transcript_52559/m.132194 type:complete len:340 (-) Transcript_52559:22-1041(-)|eukprot:CAMPEP_0177640040 /NCGR_PEP_ID=MMETSP0447-20121125/6336_1 /TAXON_ID=0 /ORGANISM="Stygamoeba regulata, Strain BSH-02190019" /LENGTH=339 /DNA_ID=CAMNT_0019142095 /DNA_START=117 /DNA_END=1136 /DNA_ORIENTATION=-
MADIPETITLEWVQSNDTASKLLRQIEFYFSDSNLPRDKFLKTQYSTHEEGVLLSTIASFKRVQQLTTDLEFIAKVVAVSNELVLSEDRTRVKRTHPLPSDPKAYLQRSLYAKGFALTATLDELIAYFSQYGTVRSVRMRRDYQVQEHNGFKGSVFVEFETPEMAEKVLAMELKVKNDAGEEVPLLLKKQSDYIAEKAELFEQTKRRRSAGDSSEDGPATKTSKVERTFEKGTLMRISNIKPDATREDLKNLVVAAGGIPKFVEFNKGDKTALMRCEDTEKTAAALAKLTAENKEEGSLTFALLDGEEEKAKWESIWAVQSSRAGNSRGKRGGRRGGRR